MCVSLQWEVRNRSNGSHGLCQALARAQMLVAAWVPFEAGFGPIRKCVASVPSWNSWVSLRAAGEVRELSIDPASTHMQQTRRLGDVAMSLCERPLDERLLGGFEIEVPGRFR
jgi:hypothetical protein